MSKRDEFKDKIKMTLAIRCAGICNFPGCGRSTFGPHKTDPTKCVKLGDAAHIHAAASNGPRYCPEMTPEQRKDISNGIWMCCNHARQIDIEYESFTAETLQIWKVKAEAQAREWLLRGDRSLPYEGTTLISLGFKAIFYAIWLRIDGNNWTFEIVSFLEGTMEDIVHYSSNFHSIIQNERFIVVESQGDARILLKQPEIILDGNKKIIQFSVEDKFRATDPEKFGCDLALDFSNESFDLMLNGNGDLSMVSGVNSAIQHISTSLSMPRGSYIFDTNIGSQVSYYYHKYGENLGLLSRLIKMEIIRLSLVDKTESGLPMLHCIDHVEKVTLLTTELKEHRLEPIITLIWGNKKKWEDKVPIFVEDTVKIS